MTNAYSLPEPDELRSLLSEMLPALPGVVYRCLNDRDWTVLELGESIRDLTGYGPESLVGNRTVAYADLIHPDDRERVWEEVQRALDAGQAFRTLYRIRTRGGQVRWVFEQGRRASGDEPGVLTGFIQDVTEWREKWSRLSEATRLLEQTVAGVEEAVLVVAPLEAGRGIMNANPAAERIFGYTREELVGDTTEPLHVSRESYERFGRELTPILERDGVVHASYPMRRKDGTQFEAEQTVSLLDPEQGVAGGAVSVVRDVSEQRRLEQEVRQSHKLEAIGQLAGGVAHDFNNLLTVIRAHSDFALLELEGSDPLASEIRAIQDAADRAAELTNQLLAFGREQVLRPRVVDLNAVVRKTRRLLARTISEEIEIRTDLAPDPLPLEVDPGQLEQAIINLAVNARDAMPDGGTLTLSTDQVESAEGGSQVRLVVADTGFGMDEETRARVFEPFFTTKGKERGTGLGLATVFGFVSQTGGAVEVDSEPGQGTVFTLRFPRTSAPLDPTADAASSVAATITEARVLVVEDDPNVQRVVRKTLERAGCAVDTADDGESALAILADHGDDYDLILTDLVLPGVGGREIVDRVINDGLRGPVVVMSGYAEGEADSALPAEVEFLQKPFNTGELVDTVKKALGRGG